MSTVGKSFPLQPQLPIEAAPLLQSFYDQLKRCRCESHCLREAIAKILDDDRLAVFPEDVQLSTRLFFEVVQDFLMQGWCFEYREEKLFAVPPEAAEVEGADRQEVKRRLRSALVVARDEQLRDDAVRRFILDLERPRRYRGRQVSVLNLFLSPRQLGSHLRRCLQAPPAIRADLLRQAIQPYLQQVTDDRDEFTNIRLIDIWRYCRYTWSLPLSAQPGRQMMYLVRDAAREFHPVIGIGALGNAVVQITVRDREIGWTLDALEKAMDRLRRVDALEEEIDRALGEIHWEDLLGEDDVAHPSESVVGALAVTAAAGPPLNVALARDRLSTLIEDTHSDPYRKKRAKELEQLLRARRTFQEARAEVANRRERLKWLLSREGGRRALATAQRSIKKRHIDTSIMEITTCGAVPPYNELLGGKLVALLMASPRVARDYRERYSETVSEIASRMKGDALIRPSHLVLLGTTSLYHVGSSQYNRLRAPANGGLLEFRQIGKTRGFGSVQLSQRTYRTLQELLRHHPELSPESSAFAAGVNYKLRSIGSGLAHVGLARLQRHETPRLVYLVALASNWREYLVGLDAEPKSIFGDLENPDRETSALVDFWKDRWFLKRAQRPETLAQLRTGKFTLRVSDLMMHEQPGPDLGGGPGGEPQPVIQVGGGNGHRPDAPTLSWQQFAELVGRRASFAEHLRPEELEALHIPTNLDRGLLDLVSSNRRLYLAGNPGDGKTHLIRRHARELEEAKAITSLDASAEDESAVVTLVEAAIREGRPAVIAINEGPLRRLLPRLPETERSQLLDQLDRPYVYRDGEATDCDAVLINLGLRQVLTSRIVDGALNLAQHRVDFAGAPAAVLSNHAMLGRPRVRERLASLLELVARSGGHATMHELLAFVAWITTSGEPDPERAISVYPYYDLVFDPRSPLISWLSRLDPASIPHPLVDMRLWDGDPQGLIEWLETPEGPAPRASENHVAAIERFRARKRRYLFEAKDGDVLLGMLPQDRKSYYDLLSDSANSRDTAKVKVLEALAYFFGDKRGDSQGQQLRIWTGLRYEALGPPGAMICGYSVPADKVELLVPCLRPQVESILEYQPSHIRLAVQSAIPGGVSNGLDLDLELWLALMQLKRGMPQRHHDPVIGRRLTNFMSCLAAEYQENPAGYVELQVRDVASGRTYGVAVSVDKRKYRW